MPDHLFFNRTPPKTLAALSEIAGATLANPAHEKKVVEDIAPLNRAEPHHITFLDNVRYRNDFRITRAGACIVAPGMEIFAPEGIALLVSRHPYKSYALVAQAFYPEIRPAPEISARATIHPDVKLGAGCVVEEGAVIKQGAEIGEGTWIEANAVIGQNVRIGADCRIGPNAVVTHSLIGDHVRIYPGCCIGQDGFGFAIDPAGHVKVPQLGRVLIEDSVEIGANTTVDRGSTQDTVIGQGTWIDNLVQIGHNVKTGRGCVIAGQAGIAGSAVLEDYVVMAGQSGVSGHLRIGKGAQIGAKSGVMRDIPAGAQVMGYPAVAIKSFMRQANLLNRLINKKNSEIK